MKETKSSPRLWHWLCIIIIIIIIVLETERKGQPQNQWTARKSGSTGLFSGWRDTTQNRSCKSFEKCECQNFFILIRINCYLKKKKKKNFDRKMAEMEDRLVDALHSRMEELESTIQVLYDRIQTLENDFKLESKRIPEEIEAKSADLTQKLVEFQV